MNIENYLLGLSDEDRAKLAARAINMMDCSKDNLRIFFQDLEEIPRDELISRGDDWPF